MKEISYYELLKMIKDGNIPKKVNYKITGYLENYVEYTAQYDRNDFAYYELTNHYREDENIHFYLNENYLESDMFEESILIPEEEKKIPEKLEILNANVHSKEVYYENYSKEEISLDIETLQNWVNKIIDYLEYLKSKGDE